MQTATSCRHIPATVHGLEVVACGDCGEVTWFRSGAWIDPAEGLARLFGQFDLVGRVDAVGAPAAQVLAYRPPNRRLAARLSVFPAETWLAADAGLWMSHDGEHLLLAPVDPLLAANLARSLDGG